MVIPCVFSNCSLLTKSVFQIVVLSRVIVDRDQVELTAEGVKALVKVLSSDDDNAIILAGMTALRIHANLAGVTLQMPCAFLL